MLLLQLIKAAFIPAAAPAFFLFLLLLFSIIFFPLIPLLLQLSLLILLCLSFMGGTNVFFPVINGFAVVKTIDN